MEKVKLLIQAYNVHSGGGAVLLKQLIEDLVKSDQKFFVYLDERFAINIPQGVAFRAVRPTLLGRLKAELEIKKNSSRFERVLCFGNLPPLFKLNAEADLFLQNVLLINKSDLTSFKLSVRLRIVIERLWLKFCLRNVKRVIVQSDNVKKLFRKKFPTFSPVCVMPFFSLNDMKTVRFSVSKKFDFVYIASSDPHKNHLNMFRAFNHLQEQGHAFKLAINAEQFSEETAQLLQILKGKGLIEVFPHMSRDQVAELYSNSEALIYPSFQESFGMPLIEAQSLNLPIVASELDYVRDVVSPVETFDPNSYLSIARAMLRYKKIRDESVVRLKTPEQFIDFLIQDSSAET